MTLRVTVAKKPSLKDAIDGLLLRYPAQPNRKIAEILGIDWKRHSHYIRNRRYILRKRGLISDTYGRVHWTLHRLRFTSRIDPDQYVTLAARALPASTDRRATKPVGVWVRSGNRNRQLTFRSEHAKVTAWPTGRVQVFSTGLPSLELIRDELRAALVLGGAITVEQGEQLPFPEPVADHRVFPVPIKTAPPSWKIPHYRESLGLTILGDQSHPDAIEVIEEGPSWLKVKLASEDRLAKHIQAQTEVVSKLTEQLALHLEVQKKQALGLTELRDAVRELSRVISRLEQPKGEPEYRG